MENGFMVLAAAVGTVSFYFSFFPGQSAVPIPVIYVWRIACAALTCGALAGLVYNAWHAIIVLPP
jgi:hypothetical protein